MKIQNLVINLIAIFSLFSVVKPGPQQKVLPSAPGKAIASAKYKGLQAEELVELVGTDSKNQTEELAGEECYESQLPEIPRLETRRVVIIENPESQGSLKFKRFLSDLADRQEEISAKIKSEKEKPKLTIKPRLEEKKFRSSTPRGSALSSALSSARQTPAQTPTHFAPAAPSPVQFTSTPRAQQAKTTSLSSTQMYFMILGLKYTRIDGKKPEEIAIYNLKKLTISSITTAYAEKRDSLAAKTKNGRISPMQERQLESAKQGLINLSLSLY